LPEGWEEKVKELGAFAHGQKIKGAPDLLRLVFLYLTEGTSFSGTAALPGLGDMGSTSGKAVFTRFQRCGGWLRRMCEHL
jgi:hypothetical protein